MWSGSFTLPCTLYAVAQFRLDMSTAATTMNVQVDIEFDLDVDLDFELDVIVNNFYNNKSHISCGYNNRLFCVCFCHAMLCKRRLCRHVVSVRPSVCLSRSWILSKWINISLKKFRRRVATILVFPHQMSWQYTDGDPLTRTSNEIAIVDEELAIDRWLQLHCDRPPCS